MNQDRMYLERLLSNDFDEIEQLRPYAEKYNVPIMDKISTEFVKQTIRMTNSKHILEIGTAIGYSAMQFSSCNADIHVTSIERNEEMYQQAKHNINKYQYAEQIDLIYCDALEAYDKVKINGLFDLIFIDAAKAQSKKFFELYAPLLTENGLIITDNVLYHGFVSDIDIVRSRNIRQMVKKVQKYNEWLMSLEEFKTTFIDIGDGMAISKKEQKNK